MEPGFRWLRPVCKLICNLNGGELFKFSPLIRSWYSEKICQNGTRFNCFCFAVGYGMLFGCTKDDIQNQAQKIVGNSGQGGGTSLQSGEIYTQPLPSKENTHYFGEPVPVEVFTGNVEYTVNKMTVLNSFDGENFTFPKRPVENGWVSKDGALNPEYMFVLVDVNVKRQQRVKQVNRYSLIIFG